MSAPRLLLALNLWLVACSAEVGLDAAVGEDVGAPQDAGEAEDAGARGDAGAPEDATVDAGSRPRCGNGLLDPGEVRVDCGGACPRSGAVREPEDVGACPPCPPRACTRADSPFVPDGYDCIWQDEFGGEAGGGQARARVNTQSWTFQNLDVNGEAQNYTNRECVDPEHAADWNYCVQDGLLTIRARPDGIDCTDGPDADDQPDNPDCALDWGQARGATGYTSGRIMTKHKVAHRYGYIEFRARLPQHDRPVPQSGSWPAIWMLGNAISEGPPPGTVPWPACGELDIMEWRSPGNHMGYNALWSGQNGAFETCVGGSPACGPCDDGPCRAVLPSGSGWRWVDWPDFPHDALHTYGLLWTEDAMQIFIDGERISVLRLGPNEAEFQQPMYLIVNLAIGGALGGAIEITDWSTATLEVDYLRWYQAQPD